MKRTRCTNYTQCSLKKSRPDRERREVPDTRGMISLKIDNIPYQTDVSDIKKIFSEWGEVGDLYIPRNYDTGKPRGFAFVRYCKIADAERALLCAHGKMLNGRDMRVVRANSEPRRRCIKESRNTARDACASASKENVAAEQTTMWQNNVKSTEPEPMECEEEYDEFEMDLVFGERRDVMSHSHNNEEKKIESIDESQAINEKTITTIMTESDDRRKSTRRRQKPDRLEYVALGKQKDC